MNVISCYKLVTSERCWVHSFDVMKYYLILIQSNPCTLYKVLEFVTVEGNFNLVGGDKGIRNTIMVRYSLRCQLDLNHRDLDINALSSPPHMVLSAYNRLFLGMATFMLNKHKVRNTHCRGL